MSASSIIDARFTACHGDFSLQVSLQLPGRGVTVLFGHSGSGKTSVLRAMAGLERHPKGYLAINGEVWQDESKGLFVPTHRRALGYVFQEASLFPHLSVKANLEYGWRRVDAARRQVNMPSIIELLGIGRLLDRRPHHLSGGERQRVAIARALLSAPKLLLMDEPLAALDHKRKQEILPYLERLHKELAMPMIYVTHSPDELARLADHVIVLEHGSVAASGSIVETMARTDLADLFADDAGVVVEGIVAAIDAHYQLMRIDFLGGSIQVVHRQQVVGDRMRFRILARDVSISLGPQNNSSILNQLSACVVDQTSSDARPHVMVRCDVGGTSVLARITRRSWKELAIAPGKPIWVQVKAVAVLSG